MRAHMQLRVQGAWTHALQRQRCWAHVRWQTPVRCNTTHLSCVYRTSACVVIALWRTLYASRWFRICSHTKP